MPEPEWAGRRISLLAYGKVNLTLAVTGRRQDGYHTLCGVMQSIGLGNRLTLAASPRNSGEPAVSLRCDDPQLPTDRRNTAAKAAFAFLEEAGLQHRHISLFLSKSGFPIRRGWVRPRRMRPGCSPEQTPSLAGRFRRSGCFLSPHRWGPMCRSV